VKERLSDNTAGSCRPNDDGQFSTKCELYAHFDAGPVKFNSD
jgi:hypothetical protein